MPYRPILAPYSTNFNATTSDINFASGLSVVEPVAQTCLALIRQTGNGENGFGYIFGRVISGTTGGTRFYVNTTRTLGFGGSSSGAGTGPFQETSAAAMSANGIWTHVAALWPGTITAADISFYSGENGRQLAPLSIAGGGAANGSGTALSGAGNNLHIGNREGLDRTFNGDIYYVARWNRVLLLAELIRAQRLGPLSVPDGLILLWADGKDYGPYSARPSSTAALGRGQGNVQLPILGQQFYRVVKAPAAVGGGTTIPVLMHQYRQRRVA